MYATRVKAKFRYEDDPDEIVLHMSTTDAELLLRGIRHLYGMLATYDEQKARGAMLIDTLDATLNDTNEGPPCS